MSYKLKEEDIEQLLKPKVKVEDVVEEDEFKEFDKIINFLDRINQILEKAQPILEAFAQNLGKRLQVNNQPQTDYKHMLFRPLPIVNGVPQLPNISMPVQQPINPISQPTAVSQSTKIPEPEPIPETNVKSIEDIKKPKEMSAKEKVLKLLAEKMTEEQALALLKELEKAKEVVKHEKERRTGRKVIKIVGKVRN